MSRFLALGLVFLIPAISFAEEDTTAPEVLSVSVSSDYSDPELARLGSHIHIEMEASEPITAPTFFLLGEDMSPRMRSDARTWYVEVEVTDIAPEGELTFSIANIEDLAGNPGTSVRATTDGSRVFLSHKPPVLTRSGNFTREARSPSGATGDFFVFAEDALDGTVTPVCTHENSDTFPLGSTQVDCTATDKEGNEDSISFLVVVEDTTAPTLALTNGTLMRLEVGDTFVDPGYTVSDDVDPAPSVTVTGSVDTSAVSVWKLVYEASDVYGNVSQITRTVEIQEAERSGGGGGGGGGGSRAPQGELLGEVLGASTFNFTRSLSEGDSGTDVMELQKLLKEKGFFMSEVTGYFGPVTTAALRAYQSANGLEPAGVVGPRTLKLLNGGADTSALVAKIMAEIVRLRAELAKLTT